MERRFFIFELRTSPYPLLEKERGSNFGKPHLTPSPPRIDKLCESRRATPARQSHSGGSPFPSTSSGQANKGEENEKKERESA